MSRWDKVISVALVLLLGCGCGCEIRLRVESCGDADDSLPAARAKMDELINASEQPLRPVPDNTVPANADPPPPIPEPPIERPAEHVPPPQVDPPTPKLPAGWPDSVRLQKWSSPDCEPCERWDRLERPKLATVTLPDQQAWDETGRMNSAAAAFGIDRAPYFQLLRGGQVVWQGRGYWTAEQLIGKAREFGVSL